MKRKLLVILSVLFISIMMFGCSKKDKLREELKAEVKAEIEAEKNAPKDITDKDALYEFYKSEIKNEFSREDFDNAFQLTFLDVTGNGNEDVVVCNMYGYGVSPLEVVTIENNEFKRLQTDIIIANEKNEVKMEDGFLVVNQESGSEFFREKYTILAVYDKGNMKTVLKELVSEVQINGDTDKTEYELIGTHNGSLSEFEYTLVKLENGTSTIKEHANYTYNTQTLSFDIKELAIDNNQKSKQEEPKKKEETKKEIIDDTNPEYAEYNFNGRYNLKGFKNETINGAAVNYDEYVGVIVPWYSGVNDGKLEPYTMYIGPDTELDSTDLTFAVFGKMTNVAITYTENMDSKPITKGIGDLENELVSIQAELPNDMTYLRITGVVYGGEGYQNNIDFTIDTQRDVTEYQPIMISY